MLWNDGWNIPTYFSKSQESRLLVSGSRKVDHSATSKSTLEALSSYKSREIESIASLAQPSPSWSNLYVEAYLFRLVSNTAQTQQSPRYPTTIRFDKYLPLTIHWICWLSMNDGRGWSDTASKAEGLASHNRLASSTREECDHRENTSTLVRWNLCMATWLLQ
jgi:hypothetical protein